MQCDREIQDGHNPFEQKQNSPVLALAVVAIAAFLLLAKPAASVKVTSFAAALHGFPALRDMSGKILADGEFAQWLEGERLHVKLIYRFKDNREIEEKAEFRQRPELIQEKWSWREVKDGKLFRSFAADFGSGQATAENGEGRGHKRWSEKLKVESGRTFAGFGFVLAIMNLREGLIAGKKVDLAAIAFIPEPRAVSVEISHAGSDQMRMADRHLKGDRFVIHPKIPRIVKLFIAAPDTHIWLTTPAPSGFLRMEGPLVEPSDPVIRIDLLSGGESGPAKPLSEKE